MIPDDIPPDAAEAYHALVESPTAPIWTHPRQDLLTPAMRRDVEAFAIALRTSPPAWTPDHRPAWLDRWVADAWTRVPHLQRTGPRPVAFEDIPTTSRADLADDVTAFVPTDAPLDELIAYTTSGTAGALTTVPSHPVTTASYIPLIRHAASPRVHLRLRRNRLDWVTVISQQVGGYLVPSWQSTTGALMAQVQLRPHAWMPGTSPQAFLAEHDPRCLTGDPVALAELADLDVDLHPELIVSTATALGDGVRRRLEERFDAPLLDVYSLTETGPIATSLDAAGEDGTSCHHLIQPRLFVEVLRPDGSVADPGERGEITVTGGMNPSLPLVRYRTGDHAAMVWEGAARAPVLVDLEGRQPVTFTAPGGEQVNSHSVTVALRPLALSRFTVHQRRDGTLRVGLDDPADPRAQKIADLLAVPFGGPIEVEVGPLPDGDAKIVPFSTERD